MIPTIRLFRMSATSELVDFDDDTWYASPVHTPSLGLVALKRLMLLWTKKEVYAT